MNDKPKNPQAFPTTLIKILPANAAKGVGEGWTQVNNNGMTLRDYFAAAACNGCIANELFRREASHNPQVIAEFSYEVADAMLIAGRD